MENSEIEKILREIGEYLEMQGESFFKIRAYEKAADVIGSLSEKISDTYKKGGKESLEKISGIGVSIAEKIEELIKTGHLKYYEQLKKEIPVNLSELSQIQGLGSKSIYKLYKELGITNLKELEEAVKKGKIRNLEGFGEKSEINISKGLEFIKKSGSRFILGEVMPLIKKIEHRLKKIKEVEDIVIAGSVRRKKETIGDVDILVTSDNPKSIMDFFTSMPEVGIVYAHGDTKSAIKLKNGLDVDLRVVPKESYGAALNYFTGSKEHNIALRQIAVKKGYKLNEYGLFSAKGGGKKMMIGKTEQELYKALGLDYIEPELREMTGEVEAAERGKLPQLIQYGDLKGDLQVQSDWSDGADSIEDMAQAAIEAGLEYMVITDHTHRLAMAHGLDSERILKQMKEIDELNSKLKIRNSKFRILKGSECDILKDGSMDLPNEILAQLDVVGGSIHSYFNLSKEEQTKRLQKAMSNPHVDIIFHPTGRRINKRPAYELDMEAIIKTAKETKTILEIDAFPDRLDLKDDHIRQCVKGGVKLSIDSDSHSASHFSVLEYGIAQARRGWAEKKDIINTWPLEKMLSMLKNGGK